MTIVRRPLLIAVMGTGLLLGALVHHRVSAQGEASGAAIGALNPSPAPSVASLAPKPASTLTVPDRTRLQQTFAALGPTDFPSQIQQVAEKFLGLPYQEAMLDRAEPEVLTLSLQRFDCVLFVESVLAIARAGEDRSEAGFIARMQTQRYRGGLIDGYCSRLHYFSDWIGDNQQRGLVEDLTPSLGGVPFKPRLNFMSQHWQKYPRLVGNRNNRDCVERMETALNNQPRTYLPTASIAQHYDQLQAGDIVAIATALPGLDVTHTGLVYRTRSGGLGLIHAAPRSGVKVSPDLQSFVEQVDQAIGITVARPNMAPNNSFDRSTPSKLIPSLGPNKIIPLP
jgi:Protein of unknown function (DUF1460)